MIPGQGYKPLHYGKGGQITASGLPINVPSVYKTGQAPAFPMSGNNGLSRVTPYLEESSLAPQTNALHPPNYTGVDNVPGHMIANRTGGTTDLTNGPGTLIPSIYKQNPGMAGLSKGLMARNWDVVPSYESGMDVSESGFFHDAVGFPRPTSLVMPNITATAKAGLGAYVPNLTPQSLNQRLPSIVNDTPQDLNAMAQADCGAMDSWIGNNQALAMAGLVVVAYLLFKK